MSLNPSTVEKELSVIKLDDRKSYITSEYAQLLNKLDLDQKYISRVIAREHAFTSFYEYGNVPDELNEAYLLAMENVSKESSLIERYQYNLDKGENSVDGFIGTVHAKGREIVFRDTQLENIQQQFPELGVEKLELLPSTYEGVDVKGLNVDGETVLEVQVKTGFEDYTYDVVNKMQDADGDILFAVSEEIKEKIIKDYPEYSDRLYEGFEPSHLETLNDTQEGLDMLATNYGIDLPDNIEDAVPYIGEIFLVYKLLKAFNKTEKDFKASTMLDEKKKLNALKTILVVNKFGFASTMAIVGANLGQFGGWAAALVGSAGGALAGGYLSKKAEPMLLRFSLKILELTKDDLFYYKNKSTVDGIAFEFKKTSASFS